MSVTMGNAIRELKLEISGIDIDMIEQDVRLSNIRSNDSDVAHFRSVGQGYTLYEDRQLYSRQDYHCGRSYPRTCWKEGQRWRCYSDLRKVC